MKIFQVDAFAEKLFSGNPAAVVPLESWISAPFMQQIAMENNLAETAFFVPKGEDFEIRWFTPALEINLCGHATLASAFVLFHELSYKKDRICFHSKSGPLYVTRQDDLLQLDFPSWNPEKISDYPEQLIRSLGSPEIAGVYQHREYMVELLNEKAVAALRPDFSLMKQLDRMVIVTAPGDKVDFVSRFFAPTAGIDEDPVTGSAHSQLIPFWSYKLGKTKMVARQLSARGGTIFCEQKGDRVLMGGSCVLYMRGDIAEPVNN
jgi:PhzF family phenazine biosynthesis protein